MNDRIESKIQQKVSFLSTVFRTAITAICQEFAIIELQDYITEKKNKSSFQLIQSLNNSELVINNFRDNANFFNLYFTKQYAPVENDSSTPTETDCLHDVTILTLDFEDKDIFKNIRALNINKAHGHDNILTSRTKICDTSFVKPLSIQFRISLNSEISPDNW